MKKPTIGRPKLADAAQRNVRLTVQLRAAERAAIKAHAKLRLCPESELVRSALAPYMVAP